MTSEVKLLKLRADGTKTESRGEVKDKFVVEKPGGRVHLLNRSAVFVKNEPLVCSTVEELLAHPTPREPMDLLQEKHMVVGENAPIAISYVEEEPAVVQNMANVLNQSTRMEAAYAQADKQATEERLTKAFFVLSIVIASVVLLIAAAGFMRFYGP